MVKGGYQIIDLKNEDLRTNQGHMYEGIYDKIEGTKKPIYLSGIQVDGVEYHDCYPVVTQTGSAFLLNIHLVELNSTGSALLVGKHIGFKVEDSDVVTPIKYGFV